MRDSGLDALGAEVVDIGTELSRETRAEDALDAEVRARDLVDGALDRRAIGRSARRVGGGGAAGAAVGFLSAAVGGHVALAAGALAGACVGAACGLIYDFERRREERRADLLGAGAGGSESLARLRRSIMENVLAGEAYREQRERLEAAEWRRRADDELLMSALLDHPTAQPIADLAARTGMTEERVRAAKERLFVRGLVAEKKAEEPTPGGRPPLTVIPGGKDAKR